MKGGEPLSQLLKNVQGRRPASSDRASMIILVVIILGIVGVIAGTFVMVKGLKKETPAVTAVPATSEAESKPVDVTMTSTPSLGTQSNPVVVQ